METFLPVAPKRMTKPASSLAKRNASKGGVVSECLFCGIVEGTIKGDIVYHDEFVVAFRDIRPQAPVHILIIPRQHIASLLDLEHENKEMAGHIFQVAVKLAKEQGVAKSGFRVVINCGADAGQTVFHLHYHLLGGRHFGWPPG
jgi:histidine triad (HIT) family protein